MTGEQREAIVGYVEKICAAVKGGSDAEDGDSTGMRLAFYREHELGRTWYDVADPREFLSLKPIVVESVDPNADRHTTVSCVCVYKSKDASVSDPSHAQEEALASLKATGTERSLRSRTHGENSVPFVDNKIALFLSAVNGVGCEGETPLIETPLIKKFEPREREKEQ